MDEDRIAQAEDLLRRCLDGFGAYIHGRKLKRQQRDRLREDIDQFLGGRRVRTTQPDGVSAMSDELGPLPSVKRSEWVSLSPEAQEKLLAITGDPGPEYRKQQALGRERALKAQLG